MTFKIVDIKHNGTKTIHLPKSRYFYTESNGIDLFTAINKKLKSHDRKNYFHNINSYNNNMKNKHFTTATIKE